MKGEGIRNLNETIENVRLFDVHTCILQVIQRFFHTQIISIFDVKTQNHVNRFKFINKDKILFIWSTYLIPFKIYEWTG